MARRPQRQKAAAFFLVGLVSSLGFLPSFVRAETIELVTYYPAGSATTGDQHFRSITLGQDYQDLRPADGHAYIGGGVFIRGGNGDTNGDGVVTPQDALIVINYVNGGALPTPAQYAAGDIDGNGRLNAIDAELIAQVAAGTLTLAQARANGRVISDFAVSIDINGNVGIGIADPALRLHVVQDQNTTSIAGVSNPNAGNQAVTDFRVGQDVVTGNGRYGALNYYGGGTAVGFQGYGNPNQVSLVAALGAVNGLTIATNANAPIKFLTNTSGVNNERMRINGAGQVGIGVVNPAAGAALDIASGDLFVRNAANNNNHVRIRGPTDGNTGIELRSETQGGTPYIDFANDNAADYDVRFIMTDNDGLLIDGANMIRHRYVGTNFIPSQLALSKGRGTEAAPARPLAGDGLGWIRLQGVSLNAAFPFYDGATIQGLAANNWSNTSAPADLVFSTTPVNATGSAERMRIASNGNVGIGGTPIYKLDVIGSLGNIPRIYSRTTDGSLTRLGLQSTNRHWSISNYGTQFNPQGSFNIADETSGIVRLTITTGGNLNFNGTATKPGGGGWGNSSDVRLKKNIEPMAGALEKMLALRGVTFEWKEPQKQGNQTGFQMGMVGQEVEKIFPEWVSQDSEGMRVVSIRGFEALTVEAVRELKQQNDQLRAQLGAQEREIQALQKKLQEISV